MLSQCQECGEKLSGGWVKRTREVIHIVLAPVEVIEHRFVERECAICGKRQMPGAGVLEGQGIGKHRISIQTMAMIAMLHEKGRLPINLIQWLMEAFWELHLRQGGIIEILLAVADRVRKQVEETREQVCSSPVVHADETTWRENG